MLASFPWTHAQDGGGGSGLLSGAPRGRLRGGGSRVSGQGRLRLLSRLGDAAVTEVGWTDAVAYFEVEPRLAARYALDALTVERGGRERSGAATAAFLCAHNAQLALQAGRADLWRIWQMAACASSCVARDRSKLDSQPNVASLTEYSMALPTFSVRSPRPARTSPLRFSCSHSTGVKGARGHVCDVSVCDCSAYASALQVSKHLTRGDASTLRATSAEAQHEEHSWEVSRCLRSKCDRSVCARAVCAGAHLRLRPSARRADVHAALLRLRRHRLCGRRLAWAHA
eukprot:6201900-Pleurochrysis_carterae.AAC.4